MLKFSDRSDSKTDTRILLDAIANDKIHLARFILDALDGKIIDSETEGAKTPLICAVFLQDSPARSRFMNLLLQRGATVNRPDESGRTALSYACEMGHLDAVKILVKNGADPEAADAWGNTALMYAVVAGRPAIVEFLVRAFKRLGLQIDRQNKVGNSAMEVAKHLGHAECVRVLASLSGRIHDSMLVERLSAVSLDGAEGRAPPEDTTRLPTGLTRRRSLGLRNRIQSMDSIEEYERESDAFSSQGLVFSGALSSKPPQKHAEHLPSGPSRLLPPLIYSPRPSKAPGRSCAPPSSSGPLGILLTPFGKNTREELEKTETARRRPVRRFDDCYYQKRCSLPTSTLASAALECSKAPLKSPVNAGNRSMAALGGRLLRRFTFPELKRSSREDCGAQSEASDPAGRCIPRSDTFPLGKNHPQVGSKPSIDSISAVQCEFDVQCRAAPGV